MQTSQNSLVELLLRKGVRMPQPASVYVADDIRLERISHDCVIHPGCRLSGAETSVGPGCVLGEEAPVALVDCRLGREVRINGGYASGSTFLDRSSTGSGAHIRPGCLLEEGANVAHAAGLKQTILFPRVTSGSLVNFCDCIMAGGTLQGLHSEIGSSYVHFNFTPRGDKATASIFGDVPRGVLLNQPPIFLGGQGGAAGPLRVDFGVFVPAGIILRRDVLNDGEPPAHGTEPSWVMNYPFAEYRSIKRIVNNCLFYIGNLLALRAWYKHARAPFMTDGTPYLKACFDGAMACMDIIWNERIKRLQELAQKAMASSNLLAAKKDSIAMAALSTAQAGFAKAWPGLHERLESLKDFEGNKAERDSFLAAFAGNDYLEAVAGLPATARASATAWLASIVSAVENQLQDPTRHCRK